MIDNKSKPSDFGATDGDELICFVDVVMNNNMKDKSSSAMGDTSFVNKKFFENMNLVHKPNPTSNPTANQNQKPHQETDAEYASRIISEVKFNGPLVEVYNHNCLYGLFLNTLRNHDQRLYQVYISYSILNIVP